MRKLMALLAVGTALLACSQFPLGQATVTPVLDPDPATHAPTATRTPRPLPTLAMTPAALEDEDQRAAMLEAFVEDVALLDAATAYSIQARVVFEGRTSQAEIEGVARIVYRHPGPDMLEDLVVMLWPNNDQYRASMTAGPAAIGGAVVQGEPLGGGLAMRYSLPAPLAAGDSVDVSVPFRVVAEGPIGGSTPHRFGITEGVLFAPTFYPLVPLRLDGAWQVADAPPGGDTTTSAVAGYRVELTVPDDLALVATGTEITRQPVEDGQVAVTYVSGPVRDFAFALGSLVMEETTSNGVAIRVWVLPQHEFEFDKVLQAARIQVGLLTELVGPYPYTELDIVDVPGAYGGIEYPSLVTVGTLGGSWVIEPVVHEVAHQWFYGLIGDDQIAEPWLDEAFATYATALYYERSIGTGRYTGYLSDHRDALRTHPQPDMPIGRGVGEYGRREYGLFVYLKGSLFYDALRQELGDDVFFDFLRSFFQEYRYLIASSADFERSAEATCGCQLDDLFDLWVFEGGPVPGLE